VQKYASIIDKNTKNSKGQMPARDEKDRRFRNENAGAKAAPALCAE
jgi:hypothetical protein